MVTRELRDKLMPPLSGQFKNKNTVQVPSLQTGTWNLLKEA